MGWFDGFPFKSKEQQQKEQREFERRVFPLGPAQKEHALGLLVPLLPGKKVHDSERLFAFITAKDAYVLASEDGDGDEKMALALAKLKWLNAEQAARIQAMVKLEAGLLSLEDYPTEAQVLQAVKTGAAEVQDADCSLRD